jgi:peptidoglycan hydrolase-like protein with peptidoglycan-binding domain
MKDGLLPVVAVAGAVSVALLWTVSANDPYWRLFESTSLPAPAYEAPEDIQAALENAPIDLGNADASSASPPEDPLSIAQRSDVPLDVVLREAETATIPEPMIALIPPFEPEALRGPEGGEPRGWEPSGDLTVAYEVPRALSTEPLRFEPLGDPTAEQVLAFAPMPLSAPAALRNINGASAEEISGQISGSALDPFQTPLPPAQPHFAADEASENALALERVDRIDVQRRLALAGFDPSGFDGTFGPQTRHAISDFQAAWGFPATGYLEPGVVADLTERTEEAYQALRRQAAAAPSAAPELAPVARERQLASAGEEEQKGRCARRSDGRIIERQSLACDLAGFSESFVSLGRNNFDGEEGSATEVADGASRIISAGTDR